MFDILIIGAGPAGLTAAIYGAKAGLKTAYIEQSTPGGKLISIDHINNLPGFENISGPDLAKRLYEQATEAGAFYISGKVVDVCDKKGYRAVFTDNGVTYFCRALIVASGINDEKIDIKGAKEYTNKGLSYCTTCDGALAKNKVVAIVGYNEQAINDALYMANIAKRVFLISKTDLSDFRAGLLKINVNAKIKKYLQYNCVAIEGDGQVINAITIESLFSKEQEKIAVDFIFIANAKPQTLTYLSQYHDIVTNAGIISVDANKQTGASGIYAIGDISRNDLHQIMLAMGDASVAVTAAITYIRENFK
jgi:thioredoxin reductase (NADPH)